MKRTYFRRAVASTAALFLAAVTTAWSQVADPGIEKTGPDLASADTDISYQIAVQNGGPDDAPNATVSDPLPLDMTFVSLTQIDGPTANCSTPAMGSGGIVTCTIATLAAGESAHFTFVFHIPPGAAEGTTYTNIASIASDAFDVNDENDQGTAATTVAAPLADLEILKSGPSALPADTDITYTITVTNHGPADATTVAFSDTLPNSVPLGFPQTFVGFQQTFGPTFSCTAGSTTSCTISTFASGATATFSLVGHIPAGSEGRTYTNTVSISSDHDPTPGNDGGVAVTTVASADVGVSKNGPATAQAGGPTFTYVVQLSSNGPDAAVNATFTDTLPPGVSFVGVHQDTGPQASCIGGQTVSCTVPVLGAGASAQFSVTARLLSSATGVITNTANASSEAFDANANNDHSSTTLTATVLADVVVVKAGPATGIAGADLTYGITVSNSGPSDAANVQVVDAIPAGASFVSLTQTGGPSFGCSGGPTVTCGIASLAAGAVATFDLVVRPTQAGSLSNTAIVATQTAESSSTNDTSTTTATVSTLADVGIVKSGPAQGTLGQELTYTLTVNNVGPSDAANVQLADLIPAAASFVSITQTSGPLFTCSGGPTVSCTIASLAASASASFALVVRATQEGELSNTATVTTETPDSSTSNDSFTTTASIGAAPIAVPTLTPALLTLLALLLAAAGARALRP